MVAAEGLHLHCSLCEKSHSQERSKVGASANVISRVRSRVASIIRYGSLPPAVLCLLYIAFVLPLLDYCDVVWCPTTTKLTAMIERVHSKFVTGYHHLIDCLLL